MLWSALTKTMPVAIIPSLQYPIVWRGRLGRTGRGTALYDDRTIHREPRELGKGVGMKGL